MPSSVMKSAPRPAKATLRIASTMDPRTASPGASGASTSSSSSSLGAWAMSRG